jgi:hypothetical protein
LKAADCGYVIATIELGWFWIVFEYFMQSPEKNGTSCCNLVKLMTERGGHEQARGVLLCDRRTNRNGDVGRIADQKTGMPS